MEDRSEPDQTWKRCDMMQVVDIEVITPLHTVPRRGGGALSRVSRA